MCIKCKQLILKKGFSLVEMMAVIVIMGIIAAVTLPQVSTQKTNKNLENNAVKCVKTELANDLSNGLNTTACQNTIKFAKYKKMKALDTVIFFADHGSADEQNAARKVLREGCDEGGEDACKYFIDSCRKDSTKCDIASSDYDIDYYLKLLKSNGSKGRMIIRDLTEPWYDLDNSNIVVEIDLACNSGVDNDEINTACEIKGISSPTILLSAADTGLPNDLKVTNCNVAINPGPNNADPNPGNSEKCWIGAGTDSVNCDDEGCGKSIYLCNHAGAEAACSSLGTGWRLPSSSEIASFDDYITDLNFCDAIADKAQPWCRHYLSSCIGSQSNICIPNRVWAESSSEARVLTSDYWMQMLGLNSNYAMSVRCVKTIL